MKTRLLKLAFLTMMLVTFFGCFEEYEKERDAFKDKLRHSEQKLKECVENKVYQESDAIYFNVVLSEDYNDDYQLIHLEGKYSMPYLIQGKFKVKFRDQKCYLESIAFKIISIDGGNYKISDIPTLRYDQTSGQFKSKIEVELSTSSIPTLGGPTLNNINLEVLHKKILDITVNNSKNLTQIFEDKFAQNDDDQHWTIKCCGGAICKVKFNIGG